MTDPASDKGGGGRNAAGTEFRAIANLVPTIIWLSDADGTCTFLSQAWYDLTGQAPDTGLGQGWQQMIHPDDRERSVETFDTAWRKRERCQVEYRVQTADGDWRWLLDTASPRTDDEGRFAGFAGSAVDITGRVNAEQELSRTGALLDTIFETAPIGLGVWDRDLRFVRVNRRLADLNGMEPEAHIGRRPDEILPDIDGIRALMDSWRDILETGEPARDIEIVGSTPAAPGIQRSWNESFFPIRHGGQIIALGAVVEETTERKRAEEAKRDSENRFRSLAEGIPQLVWRADVDGSWTWASPQWERFTGQSGEESLGEGWTAMVHPDDRSGAREAWTNAFETDVYSVDCRIHDAEEDRYRWFQVRAVPTRNDDGQIIEWLGSATDVDVLRGMHDRQRLLHSELQHRVRNTLAVIRSIARRTARTSHSTDEYVMNFEGRVDAFARLQAIVNRDPGRGVDLEQIIGEELLACAAQEGDQASLKGPTIRLNAKPAESVALAIHELATNAIKFGALSANKGRIDIAWSIINHNADHPSLRLEWKERGVPHPPAPRRKGFGSELLTRSLGYELQANVSHVFEPDGVRCTIEMPLTPRILAGTSAA